MQGSIVSESTIVVEAQVVVEAAHINKTKSVVLRFFKITDARNAKEVSYENVDDIRVQSHIA